MSHIEDMLGQYENSRKLREIKNDNFSTLQDYFTDNNLANSRMKFKSQTEMLKKFPENYKKNHKNKENVMKCNLCPGVPPFIQKCLLGVAILEFTVSSGLEAAYQKSNL